MGYFAKIENGLVVQVISINNTTLGEPEKTFPETELVGKNFIADTLKLEGEWIQTSYNGNFRSRYAGIGMEYDTTTDSFVEPIGDKNNELI
jgi:hypothetical protein